MAYSFDGADDISYGDITEYNNLSTLSAHGWLNVDDITTDHNLFSNVNTTTLERFLLNFDDVGSISGRTDTITIFMELTGGLTVRVEGATGAIAAGGWQPTGFSFLQNNGSGLRLYIDGAEDANSPVSTPDESIGNPPDAFWLGKAGSGDDMVGDIAEVAMWSRVLTTGEFAILGAGYSALFLPEGLIFYAPIIRDTRDIISGHAGSITGAVVADHPPIIYPSLPQIISVAAVAAEGAEELHMRGKLAYSRP